MTITSFPIETIQTELTSSQLKKTVEESYMVNTGAYYFSDDSADAGPALHAAILANRFVVICGQVNVATWPSTIDIPSNTIISGNATAKLIVYNNETLFAVTGSNIDIGGFDIEFLSGGIVISYNDFTEDYRNIWWHDAYVKGTSHGAIASDANVPTGKLVDSGFFNLEFEDCLTSGIRVSGIKAENIDINNVKVNGSGRNGIYFGYVKNDGTRIITSDINNVVVRNCQIKNIILPEDPGGVGSYGIYVSGENVRVLDNTVENMYALDGTSSYENFEPIYSKSRRLIVRGNVVKNCTNNQGGIAVKGLSPLPEVNGNYALIDGNIITNDSREGTFDSATGIWAQAEALTICNNHFRNLSSRVITLRGDSPRSKYFHSYSNIFTECDSDQVYQLNGEFRSVHVSDDKLIDITRTSGIAYVNGGSSSVAESIKISNLYIEEGQLNPSAINIVACVDLDKIIIRDCEFPAQVTSLVKTTGTVTELDLIDVDARNVSTPISGTGTITTQTVSNCKGIS